MRLCRMTPFTLISLLVLLLVTRRTLCLDHCKHEAHTLMKRMAEVGENFEDSDIARVHLVEGQTKRRLARRDLRAVITSATDQRASTLQLELSSGSRINLALRQSGLVDENTVVSYHTESGRVEGRRGMVDCYFHGHVEDTSGKGLATVSHCDGLFGFANTPDYRYFLHPIENKRSKRDAEKDYDVHVMWRRSDKDEYKDDIKDEPQYKGDGSGDFDERNVFIPRTAEDRLNASGFVIELAMFSDANYCKLLRQKYPGREDDFHLTRLAGTQALYGDPQKVGYEVQIKVKLLEYWTTNPTEYVFTQKFPSNLRSFCRFTAGKYAYDVLVLNTGISKWSNGQIGLAYTSSACTVSKCLVLKGLDLKSFAGLAHEIGHTLGLAHEDKAKCPKEMKSGGFMGGGRPFDFSPCMRLELKEFIAHKNSQCLFEEAAVTKTTDQFLHLPQVLPPQTKTADELCELLAGPGYNFGPHENPFGSFVCKWFLCLNEDKTSPEFGHTKKFVAPVGFSCNNRMICSRKKSCTQLSEVPLHVQMAKLLNLNRNPMWSEWSAEFSECSRTCGTGVRTRRRECLFTDFNTGAYCRGMPVKAELCNTEPCDGEPTGEALRQLKGNEVCARFLRGNVKLNLKGAKGYRPIADKIKVLHVGPGFWSVHSKSCYITCRRSPRNKKGDVDAIMPDGALCTDRKRSIYDMIRFNIQLRCIRGLCLEITDCPKPLQEKDKCGVCGGDSSRCVTLKISPMTYVPRKSRVFLTIIPAGSENIDVRVNKKKNVGVVLELWSNSRQNIIGEGGQYSRRNTYEGSNAVPFAGTLWTYRLKEGYFRAPGPIREPVVVLAMRLGRPIRRVSVDYARGVLLA